MFIWPMMGHSCHQLRQLSFSHNFVAQTKPIHLLLPIDGDNNYKKTMKIILDKTFHTKCMGKAGDISRFTKVDLTKHDLKQMMIESCDEAYQKCSSELVESSKTLQDELIKIHKSADESEHKKYKKCTLDVLKK
ncbi:unnamed protein product [Medioppia subpectinata]|uniref:Uncharacterized protein n=1 Tax=Medioppia subpectinata TaxID=1979941 RepID=A0A7R9PWX5_9ACAR|nr:unnamed protein product [Medioppia subpectinata]CAG2103373.1 unnamed protein product [Medioppia subpectinata]